MNTNPLTECLPSFALQYLHKDTAEMTSLDGVNLSPGKQNIAKYLLFTIAVHSARKSFVL